MNEGKAKTRNKEKKMNERMKNGRKKSGKKVKAEMEGSQQNQPRKLKEILIL